MIGYLRGTLVQKSPEFVLIDTGGVGYEVEIPASSLCRLPAENHECAVYIHTHVREDAIRLFGFSSLFDRRVFETLLQVSSVGPKLAMAVLGPLDGIEVCQTIVAKDAERFVKIPGIGLKTAERLMLELDAKCQKLLARYAPKDRLRAGAGTALGIGARAPQETLFATHSVDQKIQDSLNVLEDLKGALTNLGYKEKQIADVMSACEKKIQAGEDVVLENMLRDALRKLSGHVVQTHGQRPDRL